MAPSVAAVKWFRLKSVRDFLVLRECGEEKELLGGGLSFPASAGTEGTHVI